MSERVDRKVQEVRVAEFLYRHEAEFAAGFLEDAGIPFRLQADDAGGAELGMTISRPATLWVRSVDWRRAREALAMEDDAVVVADRGDFHAPASPPAPRHRPNVSRLTALERGVSGGLALASFSALPFLPFGPYSGYLGLLFLGLTVGFLVAAATGRTVGLLERLVRALAGSPPA